MAVTVGSIGTPSPEPTGKKLDTTVVVTTEGSVHREGVFAADPEDAAARGNIRNTTPGGGDYGVVTRPIVAALPLPAGASTEATLAALAANTPPLGQALMLASSPVTIASDQLGIYDRYARRAQEMEGVAEADLAMASMVRRSAERVSLTDRRGSVGKGSTR